MSETLYRKYRPQVFDDLIGQQHVRLTLLNELTSGRVAHAYLFSGPRGVGKTTVARLLAKAVNCLHPLKDGGPDNACESCVELREGRSLDLIEIDAASHTGVDHVREQIIENARFTPSRWKYKVFIIDEVHMLSLSAFNALLKTLEEPPAHALFILATTEIHKVPETIISRCQRFDFRKLRLEDLVERLKGIAKKEKIKVADDVLMAIARFAHGSSRDAENLLGQILTLGEKNITMEQAELVLPRSDFRLVIELFDSLVRKDATNAITLVNRLVNEGVNLSQFVQNTIEFLRKVMLLKVNSQLDMFSSLEMPKDEEKKILEQVERVALGELERMITVFLDQEQNLRMSFIPQLPLELAVLELTVGGNTFIPEPPVPPAGPSASASAPSKAAAASAPMQPIAPAKTEKPQKKVAKGAAGKQTAANLSLATVQQRWKAILEQLQVKNQSLRLTLNVAEPREVVGTTLVIAVGFEFHRERIDHPRHRGLIEEVMSTVLEAPVTLKVIVASDVAPLVNFEREANVVEVQPQPTLDAPSAPAGPGIEKTWDALIDAFGGGEKAPS